jgi:hypothetical protein
LIATLLVPILVAVTVCEPVVPTTVATETLVGVTTSVAEADCESGLEFAAEETTPTQPEAQMHPAKKADRNTRTTPRFTRKEFTWIFFLRLNFYFFAAERGFDSLRKQSWRGQEPGCANASFEWAKQQLVRRTVSGHGMDSPGTVLLIVLPREANFPKMKVRLHAVDERRGAS